MFFCEMRKDEKTFLYFKKYAQEIGDKNIMKIDNEVQAIDIREHCKRMNISEENSMEIISWSNKNAAGMRVYLNTIKYVYAMWLFDGHDWDDITWVDFQAYEDKMNNLRQSGKLKIIEMIIGSLRSEEI